MRQTLVSFSLCVFALGEAMHAAVAHAQAAPVTPPAGFVADAAMSKSYDYFHAPITYVKNGATVHVDPEGRSWVVFWRVTPANKTSDATDAAMRQALRADGWELLTPSGTLVAHKQAGAAETWLTGAASSGDFRATIVEVGKAPHSIALAAPAAAVETVGTSDDFPYLSHFPGAKLTRTVTEAARTFNAAPPGKPEELVGQPLTRKEYTLPATVSPYEFVSVYRDALTKAGWTVVRTGVGTDAQVVAHWAKGGRDLFAYLAGDAISVADVGAQNEAKKLAADLARDGHVAVYGIYFDIDQATLTSASDVALQHMLALLSSDATLSLEVQGHTDNTGTSAHNLTLSDQRAAAVRAWLVEHGVAAARLTAKGFGDTQPAADNKTPEGRAKNRRVELKKR